MIDSVPNPGDPPSGSEPDLEELLPDVYDDLRRLALRYMSRERTDHTLQATALTHEAYIRLLDQHQSKYREKSHLMAIAAQAMRRILVDHARGKGRIKRGGDQVRVSFQDVGGVPAAETDEPVVDLIALDRAMRQLAKKEPRKARVVEMLYIGGMSTTEVASVLGVTKRTVERDWKYARAWLARELKRDSQPPDPESAGPE